mgnify:CR=1 FL=1
MADVPRGSDDISIEELREQVVFMLGVIVVLLGGELVYRWLTDPTDSLSLIQVADAWIWNSLHSMLFVSSSVTVLVSTYGLRTVMEIDHSSFYQPIPVAVTD